MFGLMLWLSGGAWAQGASELLEAAEVAYAGGRLDEAESLASRVGTDLAAPEAATALRLRFEIALRQGDTEQARRVLSAYQSSKLPHNVDAGWAERATWRAACDEAERAGELSRAEELLALVLTDSGRLRPAEQSWADWARVRLDIRSAELFDTPDTALARIDAVRLWPGSPEEQWLDFARARVTLAEAEARCDWPTVEALLVPLRASEGAPERGVAEVATLRAQARKAVQAGEVSEARRQLAALQALPQLSDRDLAWAEGYAAWLEREQLRQSGAEIPGEITDTVTAWRVFFPNEGRCEEVGLERRASWGEQRERVKAEAHPERAEMGSWAPSIGGSMAVGLGPMGWVDYSQEAKAKEGHDSESHAELHTLVVQPVGALTLRSTRAGLDLGLIGGMQGSVMLDAGHYWSGELFVGPSLDTTRWGVAPLAGVRTLSMEAIQAKTKPGPPRVGWCHYDFFCPQVGTEEGDYWRGVVPVGFLGVALWGQPTERLTLSLRGGGGQGPPQQGDYTWFEGSWVGSTELRWTTPLPWLAVGVQGYGAGMGFLVEDAPPLGLMVEYGGAVVGVVGR